MTPLEYIRQFSPGAAGDLAERRAVLEDCLREVLPSEFVPAEAVGHLTSGWPSFLYPPLDLQFQFVPRQSVLRHRPIEFPPALPEDDDLEWEDHRFSRVYEHFTWWVGALALQSSERWVVAEAHLRADRSLVYGQLMKLGLLPEHIIGTQALSLEGIVAAESLLSTHGLSVQSEAEFDAGASDGEFSRGWSRAQLCTADWTESETTPGARVLRDRSESELLRVGLHQPPRRGGGAPTLRYITLLPVYRFTFGT